MDFTSLSFFSSRKSDISSISFRVAFPSLLNKWDPRDENDLLRFRCGALETVVEV